MFDLSEPTGPETVYAQWVGRKKAALRRSKLDCGHPNTTGDVHYHYWCDRLTCSPECAETEHDCGEFGGAKSGSEEEVVAPEAVVEAPALRMLGVGIGTVSWIAVDGTVHDLDAFIAEATAVLDFVTRAEVSAPPVDAAVERPLARHYPNAADVEAPWWRRSPWRWSR